LRFILFSSTIWRVLLYLACIMSQKHQKQLKDHRILVVEDEEACRHVLQTFLTMAGATVTAFARAEEAVASLKQQAFDAVVTDICLPGISGLDLLRSIRASRTDLPVILVTGFTNVDSAIEALHLGAQDYLLKPIRAADPLVGSVARAVEHRRLQQRARLLQRRLRESEETFRVLFQEANDACFVYGLTARGLPGPTIEVNQLATTLLSRKREAILHTILTEMIPTEYRGDMLRHLKEVRKGGTARFETVLVGRTGNRVPVEICSRLVPLKGHKVVMSSARDITDRVLIEQRVADAVEDVRSQLGRELHDVLCQDLSSISVLSGLLRKKAGTGRSSAASDAGTIHDLSRDALQVARRLSAGLFPSELDHLGLVEALQHLAATEQRVFKTGCRFEQGRIENAPAGSMALHLYRIAQEAVLNARRHGRATDIIIRLTGHNGVSTLAVEDNGSGIGTKLNPRNGVGLHIMRHRARIIGAALDVTRQPGKGTTVTCTWPTLRTPARKP